MGKYLRKYNKVTGQWEIISPNYAEDVIVTSSSSANPQTLDKVLSSMTNDISTLKKNVSWLAEHGGGGNGLGGVGGGTNYKFVMLNGGIKNDSVYISKLPYKVKFKIGGGSVTDKVQYSVSYDNIPLTNGLKEVNANVEQEVTINQFTNGYSTHTLVFEGIDANGMSIETYILNIYESSLMVAIVNSEYTFNMNAKSYEIKVKITNKIHNASTKVIIKNLSLQDAKAEFNHPYVSVNAEEYTYDLLSEGLFGANIETNKRYIIQIDAVTQTNDGTDVVAETKECYVYFESSNQYTVIASGLETYEDVTLGLREPSPFILGGQLAFTLKFFNNANNTVYYSIVLSRNFDSDTLMDGDKVIYGCFDYKEKDKSEWGEAHNISNMIPISYTLPSDIVWKGNCFVKVKCWNGSLSIENFKVYCISLSELNRDVYNLQIPKKPQGNDLYFNFDVFNSDLTDAKATSWKVENSEFYGYNYQTEKTEKHYVSSTLNVVNTNGEQSGFILKDGFRVLRLQTNAYGKIEDPCAEEKYKILENNNEFSFSIAFKTDEHPVNDLTVFQWGRYGLKNGVTNVTSTNLEDYEFKSGIKISLEEIVWKCISKNQNGALETKTLTVNIQQNKDIVVDFIFRGTKIEGDGTVKTGQAKIFVNGILNAAVSVDNLDMSFSSNLYFGVGNVIIGGKDNLEQSSDVTFYGARLFTTALNDLEMLVNSHNFIAPRDSNGIIGEKYALWKKRNFLEKDAEGNPTSVLYNKDYNKYFENVDFNTLVKNAPLPIVHIDASRAETFTPEFVFMGHTSTSITSQTFDNCTMYYYDNKVNKTTTIETVSISLQGTSTVTYRSKNFEIYLGQQASGNYFTSPQLFQPREDWFPESQFTLKADVVDSAHANNAILGKWINTVAKSTIMTEETPAERYIKSNGVADKVTVMNEDTKQYVEIDRNEGDSTSWSKHSMEIKNTIEGFPIILVITFGRGVGCKIMGIYSFNLGRYSYYNLGLKFFKYFSRRVLNTSGKFEDVSCPAVINYYDYYGRESNDNIITYDGNKTINIKHIMSFEFGGGADTNHENYRTWSQDDLSVLESIGSFRFYGDSDDYSAPNPALDNGWAILKDLFTITSTCYPATNNKYIYQGTDYVQQNGIYQYDKQSNLRLLQHLNVPNTMAYYVICAVFGMVDSLGKNFTLRTWNGDMSEGALSDMSKHPYMWYPCFYDMDTALGLTNEGDEMVMPYDYVDKYANVETASGITQMIISPQYSSSQENNRYGGYKSKLWEILRRKNINSVNTPWVESNIPNIRSEFYAESGYQTGYAEDMYVTLRKEALNNINDFIELFTEQTIDCGEILFNLDYDIKYLTPYTTLTKDDEGNDIEVATEPNIRMLHGNRIEYIRKWLTERLSFLDGVFECYNNVNELSFLSINKSGTIVLGGNENKDNPILDVRTIRPTIMKVSVSQSTDVFYFLKPNTTYQVVTQKIDSIKQLTLGSTDIITKLDNLKKYRPAKFGSLTLPKVDKVDFGGVTSFYNTQPLDFLTVYTFNTNKKDSYGREIYSSNVTEINLHGVQQQGESDVQGGNVGFAVVLYKEENGKVYSFDKLRKVDIGESCVTSIMLPPSTLEMLDVSKSQIEDFTLNDQPILTTINLNGCGRLRNVNINNCKSVTTFDIKEMGNLNSFNIVNCPSLTSITINGCAQLSTIIISTCDNLREINLSGNKHIGLEIKIDNCPNIQKFVAQELQTSKDIKLYGSFSNIEELDLKDCIGLKRILYDESGRGSETYSDVDGEFTILDLTPMPKLTSASQRDFGVSEYNSLITSKCVLNGCANIECIRFANDSEKPFIINEPNYFDKCVSLRRVFGHLCLSNHGDFSGCTNFYIHKKVDSNAQTHEYVVPTNGVVPYEESKFNTFKTDSFSTNFTLKGNNITQNLHSTFAKTSCSLYDAYYIFYKNKNSNLTSISYTFRDCSKITIQGDNNLNRKVFQNCGSVTSLSGPFYNVSNVNIMLYSISGNSVHGTLSYMPNLRSISELSAYGDKDVFKLLNSQERQITSLSWVTIKFVSDAKGNNIDREMYFIPDKEILKDLPKLTSLRNSFQSIKIQFNPVTTTRMDKTSVNATQLFYKQVDLSVIISSFTSITAGTNSNIIYPFGYGEKTSPSGVKIYPQGLTHIINSFIFSEGSPTVFYGNSFFKNSKETLIYFSNASGDTTSYENKGNVCFSGKIVKKVLNADCDNLKFPYEIISECPNLKEAPGLLSNLQPNSTDDITHLTLPNYQNNNGVTKSFFDGLSNLSNIAFMFYDLNLPFELNGFGFKDCMLLKNVNYCFARSSGNKEKEIGLQGQIPYGLFYRYAEKQFVSTTGYDYEYCMENGIDYDTGIVGGEFDEKNNYISGETLPDPNYTYTIKDLEGNANITLKFEYKLDESDGYKPCDGYGKDEIKAIEYCSQKTQGQTTFYGKAITHQTTINEMEGCFAFNKGDKMESYAIDMDKLTQNDIFVDNEDYNPIYLFVNKSYNPIKYNKSYYSVSDMGNFKYSKNTSYDPRRYVINTKWNPYQYKINKYVCDGVTDILELSIVKSFLLSNEGKVDLTPLLDVGCYEEVNGKIVYKIQDTVDEEYLPQSRGMDAVIVNKKNYAFAPDLLLYCGNNNTNIKNLFKECGGDIIFDNGNDTQSTCCDYLKYGLKGRIPSYFLEKLTTLTNIDYLFYGCMGLLPDSWGSVDKNGNVTDGFIIPPTLFKYNKKIVNMRYTFGKMVYYPTTYIHSDTFKSLSSIQDMSYCFANTAWLGSMDDNKYNPKADDNKFNKNPLKNNVFENLSTLKNIEGMFQSNNGSSSNRSNRDYLRYFSINLFTNKQNKSLENASHIFSGNYYVQCLEKKDGYSDLICFWEFDKMKKCVSPYKNCDKLYDLLKQDDKDQYKSYFN